MRTQIAGSPGVVIADLTDYSNAIDLGTGCAGGWVNTRLTLRQARKLSADLATMAARAAPKRIGKDKP